MLRPDSASAPTPASARHLPTELLRRYVAGELPAAEEHTVEAHTLECNLCAEVLEGLEMQPAAVQEASLAGLRHRLHARVAELATETTPAPAAVPLWNWRPLAAAAVLLLSLGVVAWLALRPATRPEIAARVTSSAPVKSGTNQLPDNAVAGSEAAPARPDLAVVAPDVPSVPSSARRARARVLTSRKQAVARVSVPKPPAEDALADVRMMEEQGSNLAVVTPEESRTEAAVADKAPPVAEAPEAKAKMARVAVASAPVASTASAEPTRLIQGRVTDTAGQPMPGATVLVPGTRTGTSTAPDGSFSLTVPAATPQVRVSSIGYTSQTRALRPTDSTLALALAPDRKQLSEVVVVRREAPPMLPSLGAMPAGGFPALRRYLSDSLDYPEKAFNEHQEGTVRVQFVVGADGSLSDFKVVRKLSPECDEEALRLLKEGPAWFPAVQNNRRVARKVELNIPFKIERPR